MSGYLIAQVRQARGAAGSLRLRPRARFESSWAEPEVERWTAPPSTPPDVPLPGQPRTTPPLSAAASTPERARPAPVATVSEAHPTPPPPATEHVRHVPHDTRDVRVERSEHRHVAHVQETSVVHTRQVEELPAGARARAETPADPAGSETARPRTLPRREAPSPAARLPEASASSALRTGPLPPTRRASPHEALARRSPPADAAPEITVVIGRLDVQLVREDAPGSAATQAPALATVRVRTDTAPALAEYLQARQAR